MSKSDILTSIELNNEAAELEYRAQRYRREHSDTALLAKRKQIALDKLGIIQAELLEIEKIEQRGPQEAEKLEQRAVAKRKEAVLLKNQEEIAELLRLTGAVK